MNLQEMHDEHVTRGYDKEGIKFGLQSMRWYGWASPVGVGIFLISIGVFIYLIRL